MGFLKDVDEVLGVVTAPLARVAKGIKDEANDALDTFGIYKACGRCGNEHSNKLDYCPECEKEGRQNENK